MSLPTKLEKVTLVDVVTEFKFKKYKNIEDLFIDIYSVLKPKGFEYTKLPIMELPQAIREGDPNLAYQPYYQIHKGKYLISIGPRVLSFNVKGYYSGWSEYKEFILSNIDTFSNIIKDWELEKTSMRYIDFFEHIDIFENINISTSLPENLCDDKISIGSKVIINEIHCSNGVNVRMQIANNAQIFIEGSSGMQIGGIIDLDASADNIFDNIDETIENLHNKTKKIFFVLLKDNFLTSLGPVY